MNPRRHLIIGTGFAVILAALVVLERALAREAAGQATVQAPRFEVDPMWPKPLPNGWVIGMAIGVGVDSNDHVWIVHRGDTLSQLEAAADQNPPTAACCKKAPPVLEFDAAGNLVGHWGGPGEGYEWPLSNHGIFVDHKNNVWIGGNDAKDAHILKFTKQGKFLMQFGHQGKTGGSNDTTTFGRVAKIYVDAKTNEAYIADGYGNKRVVVIDGDSGKFKRYWGAYGAKPDDTNIGAYDPSRPAGEAVPHARALRRPLERRPRLRLRPSQRSPAGVQGRRHVREGGVRRARRRSATARRGTSRSRRTRSRSTCIWRTARTRRSTSWIASRSRSSPASATAAASPGQFFAVHSIATDSKGNIFTTETYEGRRLQKFVYKGIGAVPREQGTVWPLSEVPR